MRYSRIIGTGSFLPEKILTNYDLEKMVDTTHEWIIERTGIESRHIASEDESSCSMGTIAAKEAISKAGVSPEKIDLIIVATCTPDRFFPSTACLIQEKLGIQRSIPAFDLSAACAGFIYALSMADNLIKTGQIETALVVGSEVISRIVDWEDRSVCVLFGDGAGAIVLTGDNKPGVHSTHLHAQGAYKDLLYLVNKKTGPHLPNAPDYVHMQGHDIFKLAVNAMGDLIEETIQANNIDKHAIDWLVPHQANLRIIKAIAKKLDLPMSRVILTIQEHGNTSAASVPLALEQGIGDGRIKPGDTLLFEGFGGGLTWGSALVTL